MPTYILLSKLTEAGRKTVKKKPARTKEVNKEIEAMGGKVLAQQDRHAARVDAGKVLEDRRHDDGGEPERGLVEQEEPRPRHQGAADRRHLLLAARERAGELPPPLREAREELQDARKGLWPPPAALGRAGAQLEVLPHGHRGEELAPLRDVGDPAGDDGGGREPADPGPVPVPRARNRRADARDRAERGGLSGAVRADDRDDLAPADLERHAAHGEHVAVDGLDTVNP